MFHKCIYIFYIRNNAGHNSFMIVVGKVQWARSFIVLSKRLPRNAHHVTYDPNAKCGTRHLMCAAFSNQTVG